MGQLLSTRRLVRLTASLFVAITLVNSMVDESHAAGAFAFGRHHGNWSFGYSYNSKDIKTARDAALARCRANPNTGAFCSVIVAFEDKCLAFAIQERGDGYGYQVHDSLQTAIDEASKNCQSYGRSCRIRARICDIGSIVSRSPSTSVGAKVEKIIGYPLYDDVVGITIFGPIEVGDETLFKAKVLSYLRAAKLIGVVRIFSPGGAVSAATNIGAQIRLLQAETEVPLFRRTTRICLLDTGISKTGEVTGGTLGVMTYDATTREGDPRCECESACSLIWAAGVGRHPGLVGVHRFRIKDYGKLSMEQARQVYERELVSFRRYLVIMGTPPTVINTLLATSSANMRFLDKNELSQTGNFPIYLSELVLAKCGSKPNSQADESAREKYRSCAKDLYKQKYTAGAKAYLGKYGNGEAFSGTGAK